MEEKVSLYNVVGSGVSGSKKVGDVYICQIEVDKEEVKSAFEEAEKYLIRRYNNSYYESYYNDKTITYEEIKADHFVVKDGELVGVAYTNHGGALEILYLTDADTYKQIEIYYESTDHGDTMSGESESIKLVTKANKPD